MTRRNGVTCLIVLLIAVTSRVMNSQDQQVKQAPVKDERLSRETPEGTLRVFTLGVMLANEQLIKMTIVPVPDEDLKHLLQKPEGKPPDAKELKERCANMKVRTLKPGDKFRLPGGKELVVTAEEVSDERLVLVLDDSPIPTRLYKAKGFWWVDAEPTIAGRKAAAEARRKRERTDSKHE